MPEVVIKDGVTGPNAPEPKEDLIAGKFKSQEDLVKAYKELEGKLGAPKEDPEEKPTENPEEKPKTDIEKEAENVLKVAGLDMSEFRDEFSKDGKLSEESYTKLAEKGFDKPLVDTYIKGLQSSTTEAKALVDQEITKIQESVGGEEAFNAIRTWAESNLSEEDAKAYNTAVDSGSPELARMAVENLKYRYEQAVGKDPQLLKGGLKTPPADVFESTAQVVEAMRDPRYGKDPAYTKAVAEKLGRSKVM